MAKTYELIDEIEARGEQTHERMVNAARRMRECERELGLFEAQSAATSENTPEREKLNVLIETTRRQISSYRLLFSVGRKSLDAGKSIIGYLEGDP